MSAATVDARARNVPAARIRRSATWTLAVAEARLLLRSRLVAGAAVLTLALLTTLSWTRVPEWPTVTAHAVMVSMVLAAGLFLAGHLAASREHRHRMTETYAALPTSARQGTVALLAVAPVAALVAVLVLGVHLASLWVPVAPIGRLDRWELLAAVAIPVVGATAGVAVGRLLPRAAAGPLALLGIATAVMSLPVGQPDNDLRWLALDITNNLGLGSSPQPSAWHLAYLGALTVAAGGAALLRHRRRIVPMLAIGLAAAVGAGAFVVQSRAVPDVLTGEIIARNTGPLTCQRHGSVEYCTFPGFRGWVPVWRRVIEPVVAAVPPSARAGLPAVHQRASYYHAPQVAPYAIEAPSIWGRQQHWATVSEVNFAAGYAAIAVRLKGDQAPGRDDFGDLSTACWAGGQARTVVALWLAAQSLPDGARLLRSHSLVVGRAHYGQPEIEAAARLLAQPRDAVTAALGRGWDKVTAPDAGGDAFTSVGLPAASLSGPQPGKQPCR